jgi:molybdate transport system ATP-binding protein
MTALRIQCSLERPGFTLDIDGTFTLAGITGIFGANGAGKTTLLRLIAGLEPCPSARIVFADTDWQRGRRITPAHNRRIGYVFQEGRLFPHLSVAGNLRFASAQAAPGGRIKWAEVINAFDLTGLLERRPATLSAGERQRVAIARALLADPVLMLMDEPLSSIDRNRKNDLLPYIEQLPAAFGLPVLYVTHHLDELARLARDLLLMDHGRIVAHGPIAAVLERVDLGALGAHGDNSTILEGQLRSSNEEISIVDVDGHAFRLPALALPRDARVRLRVQDRDVAIATIAPQGLSIRNVLPTRIISLRADPGAHQTEVLLDLGRQHLRARITAEAARELGLSPGQSVYALVKSVAFDTHSLA